MSPSTRILPPLALLIAAPALHAHSGHPLPVGVPELGHLHPWGLAAVAPHWLALAAIALTVTVTLCVGCLRRARNRRPTCDGRGGDGAPR